jgi:hypothetical protein
LANEWLIATPEGFIVMCPPRKVKLFKRLRIVLFIAAWALTWNAIAAPCRDDDWQCVFAAFKQSPVTKIGYWKDEIDQPLDRRVSAASDELVTFLNLDNIKQGIENKPEAMVASYDVLNDVRNALKELPDVVKQLAAENLVGIYLVRDLGGTAYTSYVKGDSTRHEMGFIVLDTQVLERHVANSWATWKESSPFIADPKFRLDAEIERPTENNRKNAIQYILLHELGHVLSIGRQFHPRWDVPMSEGQSVGKYAFAKLSWEPRKGGTAFSSRFDNGFTNRKDVRFYFGARLASDQMVPTYQQLERTNFVTLYGSTKPQEDFAEAFVSYVHTVLMGRPFEIRIYRENSLLKTYGSCWDEPRCAGKRRIIEEFLKLGTRH